MKSANAIPNPENSHSMSDSFRKIKNWFENYVEGYFNGDPVNDQLIRLKRDHTHRVCQNAVLLSNALELSPRDNLIARLTALLHDVGRFRQFAHYQTFNDALSENHARLGVREVGLHRVLGDLDKEERRLICRAIAFHNVVRLPDNEDEHPLLFMKLIRDADKLDVYKVLIQNYCDQRRGSRDTVLHKLPDTPDYSPKILEALMERKVARFEDMKSLNDFKLLQIGWVYDLNFTPSFQALYRLKYIEQIRDMLPRTKSVTTAVDQALAYVASRL